MRRDPFDAAYDVAQDRLSVTFDLRPSLTRVSARAIQPRKTTASHYIAVMHKLALLLLPLALTACGEGSSLDESVKNGIRQQLVATCTATAQGQIPEGVTVDTSTLCTCAADKIIADRSVKDLLAT